MAEREAASKPLAPPTDIPAGSLIHEVRWRYEAAPDLALNGRLCHADNCIRVPVARGRSQSLGGLSADEPLQFRFALKPGQRPGGVVEGLQVIVNYRHPAP
jgi:flagellar protein FlhE